MKMLTKMVAVLSLLALFNAPLSAQDKPVTLSGDVKAVKTVTDAAGAERIELVEPSTIVPGDRLIFGTDYANNGADTVKGFTVTNPLNSAVRLAPDADPDLTVSVDGGKSWGTLAELTVTAADGTARAATHADVTHVRWILAEIAPGAGGRLEYPAIIR
jgi:hypothetical protein